MAKAKTLRLSNDDKLLLADMARREAQVTAAKLTDPALSSDIPRIKSLVAELSRYEDLSDRLHAAVDIPVAVDATPLNPAVDETADSLAEAA